MNESFSSPVPPGAGRPAAADRASGAALDGAAVRPDSIDAAAGEPTLEAVRREVDALREAGVNLPNPRSLADRQGRESAGTFVDLGDGRVAQHLGRGDYALFDVQRDLGGVTPPIGQYATLSRDGVVDVPQRDLGRGRGIG